MPTRAKFECTSVQENQKFFASTPSGSIKISTIREDVFEPGKKYYIDFTEAE